MEEGREGDDLEDEKVLPWKRIWRKEEEGGRRRKKEEGERRRKEEEEEAKLNIASQGAEPPTTFLIYLRGWNRHAERQREYVEGGVACGFPDPWCQWTKTDMS